MGLPPMGDPPMAASPGVWLLALAAGTRDCIDQRRQDALHLATVQHVPRMRGEGAQPADGAREQQRESARRDASAARALM